MLKILLDDAIVLRFLKDWPTGSSRQPNQEQGRGSFLTAFPNGLEACFSLMNLCFQKEVEGWIMSSSVLSLYAELGSVVGPTEASLKIKDALNYLACLPLTEEHIRQAINGANDEKFIPDKLKILICKEFGLDYFITEHVDELNEMEDIDSLPVQIVSAAKFLSNFRELRRKPPARVSLLDTKASYHSLYHRIHGAMNRVLLSGKFILGNEVKAFEEAVADYCNCQFAVGLSSGTDALLVALMALEVKPGEIVITTPYSFFATAGVIVRLGARPLFVDIDKETYNMNPEKLEDTLLKLNSDHLARVRAIIPVHLFGQCADMEPILSVSRQYGLAVIEDAAQAIGSRYKNQALAGSMGTMGCFSFFPSKNLGGFGDAGLLSTNNPTLAEKVNILRSHGAQPKYYHRIIGGNFRLDALQAAMIKEKIPFLDESTRIRQANAHFYSIGFKELGLDNLITLPKIASGSFHIFNQYIIRAPNRDELKAFLTSHNIETEIYYPVPLHLQECFAYLDYKKGDFPASEQASQETLALPVYPGLTKDMQQYVMECIKAFYIKS